METQTAQQVAEVAVVTSAKFTTAVTQGGALVTIFGGLTVNELAIVTGLLVSIIGMLGGWAITWYWKSKAHELALSRLAWDKRRHDSGERGRRSFDDPSGYE